MSLSVVSQRSLTRFPNGITDKKPVAKSSDRIRIILGQKRKSDFKRFTERPFKKVQKVTKISSKEEENKEKDVERIDEAYEEFVDAFTSVDEEIHRQEKYLKCGDTWQYRKD